MPGQTRAIGYTVQLSTARNRPWTRRGPWPPRYYREAHVCILWVLNMTSFHRHGNIEEFLSSMHWYDIQNAELHMRVYIVNTEHSGGIRMRAAKFLCMFVNVEYK